MSDWIRLNTEVLNPTREIDVAGVAVKVRLSPHDVPIAVRGRRDEQQGRFCIEFKYLDDEPSRIHSDQPEFRVWVGASSGRLCSIEIPLKSLSEDGKVALSVQVPGMIENWSRHLPETSSPRGIIAGESRRAAAGAIREASAMLAGSL